MDEPYPDFWTIQKGKREEQLIFEWMKPADINTNAKLNVRKFENIYF